MNMINELKACTFSSGITIADSYVVFMLNQYGTTLLYWYFYYLEGVCV